MDFSKFARSVSVSPVTIIKVTEMILVYTFKMDLVT